MNRKLISSVLIIILSMMFLISCNDKTIKLNVLEENIVSIEVSSLPESDEYNKTIKNQDDINSIVNYLKCIKLLKTKENVEEYIGQVILIKINHKDGAIKEFNHFGSRFIKGDNRDLYELEYEEAKKLNEIIENIK